MEKSPIHLTIIEFIMIIPYYNNQNKMLNIEFQKPTNFQDYSFVSINIITFSLSVKNMNVQNDGLYSF